MNSLKPPDQVDVKRELHVNLPKAKAACPMSLVVT